jgi:choline dehydrogenase
LDGPFRWLVVGGGTAGCLLARRLAESRGGTVGLIEAGSAPRDARTVAPAWYPRAQGTRLDWGFRTEPQAALAGRQLAWPRGRALGGSSAINALIYLLPAPGDLERWSRVVGGYWAEGLAAVAAGWQAAAHGSGFRCPISGLELEPVRDVHPWCRAFLDAATAIGLPQPSPWIQSQPDVCGPYWLTQRRGRRHTTATDLLAANAAPRSGSCDDSNNLSIITGWQAERIVFQQGRAVAVAAKSEAESAPLLIRADEIILAAGAIGSPALLLRSGIGPAAELQGSGIRCVVDAPEVGANLQDHLVMPVVFQMRTEEGLPYRFSRAARQQFRDSASGPLASNLAEVGALLGQIALEGASAGEASRTPRIQLHVTPTHYLKYPRLMTLPNCMSIGITPLHPVSRGRIRLAASEADNHGLRIDPQYLSDARDAADFWEGYVWIRQAARSAGLGELISSQSIPSAARSDPAGISRSVRAMAQSIYHPVGTCRAGSDDRSVVDDRFCVRGVSGLRVADASVLPDLPSGNTMTAALLMAELAAGASVAARR